MVVPAGRADDVVVPRCGVVVRVGPGDVDGFPVADAAGGGVGDMFGLDGAGCVQPANDVAVAASTTTARIRILDHPFPSTAPSAHRRHRRAAVQRQRRWSAIRT
jgi:hypothetical protein